MQAEMDADELALLAEQEAFYASGQSASAKMRSEPQRQRKQSKFRQQQAAQGKPAPAKKEERPPVMLGSIVERSVVAAPLVVPFPKPAADRSFPAATHRSSGERLGRSRGVDPVPADSPQGMTAPTPRSSDVVSLSLPAASPSALLSPTSMTPEKVQRMAKKQLLETAGELEVEKLKWMRGAKERSEKPSSTTTACAAPAEALAKAKKERALKWRFGLEGELHNNEEEEQKAAYDPALYHHGDEPDRPGYTLDELTHLCRSAVPGQRTVALQTLERVIRKAKAGDYHPLPVLSAMYQKEIVLFCRAAVDETTITPLVAGVSCLHALVTGPDDSLSTLRSRRTIAAGSTHSKLPMGRATTDEAPTMPEGGGPMEDAALARSDLMLALVLKMNTVQRLRYIGDVLGSSMPHSAVVQLLEIALRLCDHSPLICSRVAECPHFLSFVLRLASEGSAEGATVQRREKGLLALELVLAFAACSRQCTRAMLSWEEPTYSLAALLRRFIGQTPSAALDDLPLVRHIEVAVAIAELAIEQEVPLAAIFGQVKATIEHVMGGLAVAAADLEAGEAAVRYASSLIRLLLALSSRPGAVKELEDVKQSLEEALQRSWSVLLQIAAFEDVPAVWFAMGNVLHLLARLAKKDAALDPCVASTASSITSSDLLPSKMLKHVKLVAKARLHAAASSRAHPKTPAALDYLPGLQQSSLDGLAHLGGGLLALLSLDPTPELEAARLAFVPVWQAVRHEAAAFSATPDAPASRYALAHQLQPSNRWFSGLLGLYWAKGAECRADLVQRHNDTVLSLKFFAVGDERELKEVLRSVVFDEKHVRAVVEATAGVPEARYTDATRAITSLAQAFVICLCGSEEEEQHADVYLTDLSSTSLPLSRHWMYLPVRIAHAERQGSDGQNEVDSEDRLKAQKASQLPFVYAGLLFVLACVNERKLTAAEKAFGVLELLRVLVLPGQMYRDPAINSLLSALFSRLEPTPGTSLAFDQSPDSGSVFDLLSDAIDEYTASSYGDKVFTEYLLLFITMDQPVEFRRLAWGALADLLRFLTFSGKALDGTESEKEWLRPYLYPLESDSECLALYVGALKKRKLTEASNSFLTTVAIHHIAGHCFDGFSGDKENFLGSWSVERLLDGVPMDVRQLLATYAPPVLPKGAREANVTDVTARMAVLKL